MRKTSLKSSTDGASQLYIVLHGSSGVGVVPKTLSGAVVGQRSWMRTDSIIPTSYFPTAVSAVMSRFLVSGSCAVPEL